MSTETIRKCDRCDKVGVAPEETRNWLTVTLTHSGTYGIEDIDLCDECFPKLIEFAPVFGRYRSVRE